jgi:uncharacterized membrane protein YbaN (DUF454 family)
MVKRFLLLAAGWTAVVVGIAGLFLPVLPGVLLLLAGLWLLSSEYHWARRWRVILSRRFPKAKRKLQRIFGT